MKTNDKKQVGRRRFVASMSLLGVAGFGAAPRLDAQPTQSDESSVLKVGPYLQAPRPDSITVRWITTVPSYSWVEYGETPDQLNKKAHRVNAGLVEANTTIQAITLRNLQPGKQYAYRICSKALTGFDPYKITYGDTFTSDVYTFTTPSIDADRVRFVVLNDIHDRPDSFAHLLQLPESPENDFVFLNGDMFDYQTDEDQLVNHLLKPVTSLFATRVPFILSRGNHETRGKFARQLVNYFDGHDQPFYYSFRQGPVYGIVLDSGEDKADDTPVYAGIVDFDQYRLEQAEWLKQEVRKKEFRQAKYRVVFSHIPLFYSGDWHGPMHCRTVWGPILNDANIDLLISGHTHKHGIHPAVKGKHSYPIVIGGGPQAGRRTIISVQADQTALTVTMLNDTGVAIGNLTI